MPHLEKVKELQEKIEDLGEDAENNVKETRDKNTTRKKMTAHVNHSRGNVSKLTADAAQAAKVRQKLGQGIVKRIRDHELQGGFKILNGLISNAPEQRGLFEINADDRHRSLMANAVGNRVSESKLQAAKGHREAVEGLAQHLLKTLKGQMSATGMKQVELNTTRGAQ